MSDFNVGFSPTLLHHIILCLPLLLSPPKEQDSAGSALLLRLNYS
jgi:hypothetical protein